MRLTPVHVCYYERLLFSNLETRNLSSILLSHDLIIKNTIFTENSNCCKKFKVKSLDIYKIVKFNVEPELMKPDCSQTRWGALLSAVIMRSLACNNINTD